MSILYKASGALLDEMSKIGIVRASSRKMKSRYEAVMSGPISRRRFLRGYPRYFWFTKIAFWRTAPPKFVGGLIPSLLGLHVVRHYFINWMLKPKSTDEKFAKLENDGVQTVPQLLSSKDIAEVTSFYKAHYDKREIYYKDFSELVVSSNLPFVNNPLSEDKKFQEFYNWLDGKLDFRGTYAALCGRELRCKPWVSIVHSESFPNDNSYEPQADGNNTPHRDVFYPSYKIFVYLNDVSKDNAAFRYYPGSHRISNDSVSKVYMDSIKHYSQNSSKPYNPLDESPEYQCLHFEGEAGDAVFFNVQGIHRRGEHKMDKDRERLVLLIDFRQNDALILPSEYKWESVDKH